MSGNLDQRVLVLAPRGRDAAVIVQTLGTAQCQVCSDLRQLQRDISQGAGTAIITEEALVSEDLTLLSGWLQTQPPWSDLPIVVLLAPHTGGRHAWPGGVISDLGNVIILERPINPGTLQRAVSSSLRARSRQYAAREHLEERRQFAETLESRIAERTADLENANTLLQREIYEKEQMQSVLAQSQKMEAVGQLTGGVAHDFNNLLTIIRSSVDFLRRDDISADRRGRYIEAISQTVDRAAKLTGHLLSFARRQSLVRTKFDVRKQVQSVAELVRPLVGSRFQIDVHASETPHFVETDVSQFDTALINLAVNGRDAMDGEGRLLFRVQAVNELPSVRGHKGSRGAFVVVTVQDSGCGIPKAQLAQIFEPFFTTKGVGRGTGLGLSQVFGFAKQSGGEVTVDSEEGKGAAFSIFLPSTARPTDEEMVLQDTITPPPAPRGLSILIVEDNDAVGQFAFEMLSDLGYRPTLAANAEEALQQIEDHSGKFDAVFSDVMMPGMNGLALAQILRQRFKHLPILLTSGYSHVIAQEGTHGFELLKKPYSVGALAERLEQVVFAKRNVHSDSASPEN